MEFWQRSLFLFDTTQWSWRKPMKNKTIFPLRKANSNIIVILCQLHVNIEIIYVYSRTYLLWFFCHAGYFSLLSTFMIFWDDMALRVSLENVPYEKLLKLELTHMQCQFYAWWCNEIEDGTNPKNKYIISAVAFSCKLHYICIWRGHTRSLKMNQFPIDGPERMFTGNEWVPAKWKGVEREMDEGCRDNESKKGMSLTGF